MEGISYCQRSSILVFLGFTRAVEKIMTKRFLGIDFFQECRLVVVNGRIMRVMPKKLAIRILFIINTSDDFGQRLVELPLRLYRVAITLERQRHCACIAWPLRLKANVFTPISLCDIGVEARDGFRCRHDKGSMSPSKNNLPSLDRKSQRGQILMKKLVR